MAITNQVRSNLQRFTSTGQYRIFEPSALSSIVVECTWCVSDIIGIELPRLKIVRFSRAATNMLWSLAVKDDFGKVLSLAYNFKLKITKPWS